MGVVVLNVVIVGGGGGVVIVDHGDGSIEVEKREREGRVRQMMFLRAECIVWRFGHRWSLGSKVH